jgi:HEPN domain-containing protein
MNKADLVRDWFHKSFEDFRSAAFLFNKLHPRPLEIICFHCQQSAEKTMKGFLTDREVVPEKTHDLEELRLICIQYNSSFDNAKTENACKTLTEYAVLLRYPDSPEICEHHAVNALEDAERIYKLCVSLLDQHTSEDIPSLPPWKQ